MGDSAEDYKKALTPHVQNWGNQNVPLGKQLEELNKAIGELEKVQSPNADQVKKLKDLKDKRTALCQKIVAASVALQRDLLKVPAAQAATQTPPAKPGPVWVQLPDWLTQTIKQKGIPLGKNVTVAPSNISIDFKQMKLKSAEVTVTFHF